MSRNIILVCLDTVRKDHFDDHAVQIKELADLYFSQCRSASSWTVPSHGSIFTGNLPYKHGAHTHNIDFHHIDEQDTFLGKLPKYNTIGISANPYIGSEFGVDNLFDEFHDIDNNLLFQNGLDFRKTLSERHTGKYRAVLQDSLCHDHPILSLANLAAFQYDRCVKRRPLPEILDDGTNSAIKRASQVLDQDREPFFLYLNLMEAHAPFRYIYKYGLRSRQVPLSWHSDQFTLWNIILGDSEDYQEYIKNYRELYKKAIQYLDHTVAELIKEILSKCDNETTVIVTSDHGENLVYDYEDGLIEHQSSLSESLIHVPLSVVNPPSGFNGVRNEIVSQLDIGDFIVALSEGDIIDMSRSQAPAELLGAGPSNLPSNADPDYWDRAIRTLVKQESKEIWDSLGAKVEKKIDPNRPCWEGEEQEYSDDIQVKKYFGNDLKTYKREIQDTEATVSVEDSVGSRLEDLGYR